MTATYANVIKTLLGSVDEKHKKELRDKFTEVMIHDSVQECAIELPCKRKKRENDNTVTEIFHQSRTLAEILFNHE